LNHHLWAEFISLWKLLLCSFSCCFSMLPNSWSVLSDPFGSDHLPILISIPNRSSNPIFSHNKNNTSTWFNFYATDWNQCTYHVASLLESFTFGFFLLAFFCGFFFWLPKGAYDSIHIPTLHPTTSSSRS
jgi:hypothetical protein